MNYDIDTLRNQLLACKQRSIELDQARIDAEQSARESAAAERVAVDRLRAVESEAAKHKCPPDLRGRVRELEAEIKEFRARRIPADQSSRVRELTADVKALQAQAASLRAEVGRSDRANAQLHTELEATQQRLTETRAALGQAHGDARRAESELTEQTAKTKAAQREVKRLSEALAEKPKTVTVREKPEPVNEHLVMRVRQLEAERGRN